MNISFSSLVGAMIGVYKRLTMKPVFSSDFMELLIELTEHGNNCSSI